MLSILLTISIFIHSTLSLTSDSDIVCDEERECQCCWKVGYGIHSTQNVICSGVKSCEYHSAARDFRCGSDGCSTISAGGDITCSGRKACKQSTIVPTGNAYCIGYNSCRTARVVAGGDVTMKYGCGTRGRCGGTQYLRKITAAGTIYSYANAIRSLWYFTKGENDYIASSVYCEGYRACPGLQIAITDSLKCNGASSCSGSTVIDDESGSISVVLENGNTGLSNIVCPSSGVCDVDCSAAETCGVTITRSAGTTLNLLPAECVGNSGGVLVDGVFKCPTINTAEFDEDKWYKERLAFWKEMEENDVADDDDDDDGDEHEEFGVFGEFSVVERAKWFESEFEAYHGQEINGGIMMDHGLSLNDNIVIGVVGVMVFIVFIGCYYYRNGWDKDAHYQPLV